MLLLNSLLAQKEKSTCYHCYAGAMVGVRRGIIPPTKTLIRYHRPLSQCKGRVSNPVRGGVVLRRKILDA